MFKFVFRPGFSKELRMKSRRQRAQLYICLIYFALTKTGSEIKRTACYRHHHLPQLTSFVCHMLEFIIYCGLEELSTHLGVLLGVSVLFGLFDMCDSPTCKNMATLSSYL